MEAAELLEHFQWKNGEGLDKYIKEAREEIADEISDVLFWVLTMSHDLNIDLANAFNSKMGKNEKKYPIEKVKGSNKKYTEYLAKK